MFYQELLEVYFGENQNIKEMQKCITELRKVTKKNKIKSLNTNEYIRKFNRLAEKEWGFKSFSLNIMETFSVNACTLPVSYDVRMFTKWQQQNLLVGNGFKYKPEANYSTIVFVNRGLFVSDECTDREIFAVILHEIGHNFSSAVSDIVPILSLCNSMTVIIDIILDELSLASLGGMMLGMSVNTNIGHEIFNNVSETINKKFPKIVNIPYTFMSLFSLVRTLKREIRGILIKLRVFDIIQITPKILASKFKFVHIFRTITNYRNEKIADSFATMYGYGVDTANLQKKFQRGVGGLIFNTKVQIPFLSTLMGLSDAIMMFAVGSINEHPSAISRIREQSEYLKREIEKEDIDPKVKKEMMEQIKEIDKTIDEVTRVSKEDIPKFHLFHNILNNINLKLFGGDFKDIPYNAISTTYDDVERVYNRKMNESNTIFMDVFTSLDD